MAEQVTCDTMAMGTCASGLDAVESRLGDVVEAGRTSTVLSMEAFGVMCSFMVPPTLLMQGGAQLAIEAVNLAIRQTANATRQARDDTEAIEQDVCRRFDEIGVVLV